MLALIRHKIILAVQLSILLLLPGISFATAEGVSNMKQISMPTVTPQIFDQVKQNENWKKAFLTGEQAQIVFMCISPKTNPNNEIGMETHEFDQIIFVVSGNGEAILNGKTTKVNPGDMIFIPKGTPHNVVNLNKDQPLKILSVYSQMDIPADAVYPTKSEAKD